VPLAVTALQLLQTCPLPRNTGVLGWGAAVWGHPRTTAPAVWVGAGPPVSGSTTMVPVMCGCNAQNVLLARNNPINCDSLLERGQKPVVEAIGGRSNAIGAFE
jgi:hypothetical protein